ncbi:MAG: alpha/beta hydrolase [Pseudomonadota bacterium]
MQRLHPHEINPRMGTPPEALEYGTFTNGDGASIRYAQAMPPADKLVDGKPTGVAVIVPGFRVSIERYYERIREHLDRGEAVYAMDWRGQGGSQRYHKNLPQRPGAQGYEHDAADLDQFVTQVAKLDVTHPGLRKTLYAHSMGGNIAMRYLHDYPGRFDNAVITAPMLGIQTGKAPKWLAKLVAKATNLFDTSGYMPGEKDWSEDNLMQPITGKINDRIVRQAMQDVFYRGIPDLRVGGATASWFLEACRSVAILRDPDYLNEIKTPIMLVAGGLDDVVDPEAILRAAKYLPQVNFHDYRRSGHSPWMESNPVRKKLWGHVDDFLAGNTQTPTARADQGPGTNRVQQPALDHRQKLSPWATARRLVSGPKARERHSPSDTSHNRETHAPSPSQRSPSRLEAGQSGSAPAQRRRLAP